MTVQTLILGIGNLLLGDEGVGVQAAQALMKRPLPPDVCVLDAGTAILDTAPYLETADRVIVIDAVKGGKSPGTIYRMALEEFAEKTCIASMHGFDLPRVLSLTRRQTLPSVMVIGVEPEDLSWSLELSSPVAASLPAVVEIVEKEIDQQS